MQYKDLNIKKELAHLVVSESISVLIAHILCLYAPLLLLIKESIFDPSDYRYQVMLLMLLCLLVYYLSFRITHRRILKLTSPPIRVSQKLISHSGFKWNKITLSNGKSYFEDICYCNIHDIPYLNEQGECFCPTENCNHKAVNYEDMKLLHRAASSIILKKHIANN